MKRVDEIHVDMDTHNQPLSYSLQKHTYANNEEEDKGGRPKWLMKQLKCTIVSSAIHNAHTI